MVKEGAVVGREFILNENDSLRGNAVFVSAWIILLAQAAACLRFADKSCRLD